MLLLYPFLKSFQILFLKKLFLLFLGQLGNDFSFKSFLLLLLDPMELLALDFGLPLLLEFFIEIEMNLLTQSLDLLGVGPLLESAQLVGFNLGMGGE